MLVISHAWPQVLLSLIPTNQWHCLYHLVSISLFSPHPDSFVLVPLQLKQRGNLTLPLFALSEVYHLFWGYAFSAIYKNRVCFKVLQNFDITGVGVGVNETVAYKGTQGTFLVVQWLRLGAFNAGGTGRIPGPGTKILHDTVQPKKIFFK